MDTMGLMGLTGLMRYRRSRKGAVVIWEPVKWEWLIEIFATVYGAYILENYYLIMNGLIYMDVTRYMYIHDHACLNGLCFVPMAAEA